MQIKNYLNYEIFPNEGKIFSYKSNRWIGAKNKKDDYWYCALYDDDGTVWNTKVHRVVWTAVNGEIPKGYEVNHIDENKSNNSISNLNLLTHQENINWGSHNERVSKARKGKKQPNISKALTNRKDQSKSVGAFKDGTLMMVFPSTKEAQRQGYNSGHISACCRNCYNRQGNNTYKGFQWQYLN